MAEELTVLALGASVGAAVFAVALVLFFSTSRDRRHAPTTLRQTETVFLLRDGEVIDHTPDAQELFDHRRLHGMAWRDLRALFLPGFPDLPEETPTVSKLWRSSLVPECQLKADANGKSLRLRLICPPLGPARIYRSANIATEFERLDAICDKTPDPVWQTDGEDHVVWHNDAFEDLCYEIGHDTLSDNPFEMPPALSRTAQLNRVSVLDPAGTALWFEVASRPMGDGWVHFASSIDSLVNAEMAQRNFVQTLTKTFAHLPIGLAVFDKNRQLVLFNPALVDLTHLPIDFLSCKPNLLSFFDTMRESRMMPEPKNYATWRDKLYDVVSAAREDRYCETWNLPSGLTYKITGRPHPDGAVAFLIEDISAEISLTRRFRSELELTQSVLDCFEDSVAVFSRLGVLTFSNAAYRTRWKCDPDSAFAEVTIVDATRDWKAACQPSPIWADLREFVLTLRERSTWDAELITQDGERLLCIVEPVVAGATLVRFAPAPPPRLALVPPPEASASSSSD